MATSAVTSYIKPSDALPTPANLRWEQRNGEFYAVWDASPDLSVVAYYHVEFYRNGLMVFGVHGGNPVNEEPFVSLADNNGRYENGTYTFVVRATSNDLDSIANSPTSAESSRLVVKNGQPQLSGNNSNSSGSGSGGSGGGSSGSGGGSTSTNRTPPKSDNVTSTGAVDTKQITSELTQAIKDASTTGGQPVISVKNAVSISPDTIKAIAAEAAKSGKNAVINADTTDAFGNVQARLVVEPAKLAGLKADLKLGINTQGTKVEATKAKFEKHFDNKVSVISCEQTGSFGAPLKLAAKVDLPEDTGKLVFYSYDAKTNKLTPITTAYTIDKNGYIHFATELAGDIIISDKPLTLKR